MQTALLYIALFLSGVFNMCLVLNGFNVTVVDILTSLVYDVLAKLAKIIVHSWKDEKIGNNCKNCPK